MQVLVTGATGYIGEKLTRALLARGTRVHVLVRDASKAQALSAAGATAFEADIGDPNAIARAADECDVVVHCAALGPCRTTRQAYDWVNVAGTENVLNAARHVGCTRVVHVSCADVSLSNCDRIHWKEDRPLLGFPVGLHARSKLLGEELALVQSDARMGVTALRPALVWGPGERKLLPGLCREGLHGRVRMFGSGDNLMSATFIDNLVHAVLCAMDCDGAAGRAYYVTDNEFVTAGELLTGLCRALGLPPPRRGSYLGAYMSAAIREALQLAGPWRGDVITRGRGSMFDIQAAVHDLGYAPPVSMQAGLQQVEDWAREAGGPAKIAQGPDENPDRTAGRGPRAQLGQK